jgi:glycogen synthase
MVTAECAPAVKTGGLGDVVSGLSRELELRGHAVEIILPKYASLRLAEIWDLQPSYRDLWVPWYEGAIRCTVRKAWNPESDPLLPDHCSAGALDGKYTCRQALRDRFWLRKAHGPVVGYVGRLDEQKGMHLVRHALFYTLARAASSC